MKTEMPPFQGIKKPMEFVVGAGEVLGNYSLTWLFKIILTFLFFGKIVSYSIAKACLELSASPTFTHVRHRICQQPDVRLVL